MKKLLLILLLVLNVYTYETITVIHTDNWVTGKFIQIDQAYNFQLKSIEDGIAVFTSIYLPYIIGISVNGMSGVKYEGKSLSDSFKIIRYVNSKIVKLKNGFEIEIMHYKKIK